MVTFPISISRAPVTVKLRIVIHNFFSLYRFFWNEHNQWHIYAGPDSDAVERAFQQGKVGQFLYTPVLLLPSSSSLA